MRMRIFALLFLLQCSLFAVIIDRIAVIVGNSIVKDSDIERDLRTTAFLNGEPLDLSASARKKAAARLIDQIFIRQEIRLGDYSAATAPEAQQQLDALKKQRFPSDTAYRQALARYGLTDLDLRTQFQWQLTVLNFIDVRFKPAVLITDKEVENYYHAHPARTSLDDARASIQDVLTGEKVNALFFAWLDDQRKATKINYLEGNLA